MSETVGTTFRWTADLFDSLNDPINADILELTVYDPTGAVVTGFPVLIGSLVHDSLGVYHYDWAIPSDVILGVYVGAWSGAYDRGVDGHPLQISVNVPFWACPIAGAYSALSVNCFHTMR